MIWLLVMLHVDIDLNDDVTFLFSTNQRPRNYLTQPTTKNQFTSRLYWQVPAKMVS